MVTACRSSMFGFVVLGFLSGVAFAAPGDIHRVSGAEVVNLRAGPTEASNIRGRVDQGDEVIELTRDGNWIGVRVLQTGEEGWIYGGLLERVAQSGLLPGDGGTGAGGDAGFLQLSEDFDRLIRRINDDLGYPMVEEAAPVADGVLQVRPTAAWLRSAGRDAHMMGALALPAVEELPERAAREPGDDRRAGPGIHPDRRWRSRARARDRRPVMR